MRTGRGASGSVVAAWVAQAAAATTRARLHATAHAHCTATATRVRAAAGADAVVTLTYVERSAYATVYGAWGVGEPYTLQCTRAAWRYLLYVAVRAPLGY